MYPTLRNRDGKEFFSPERHIHGDTRIKLRCQHYLRQLWQKECDCAKHIMGASIGIDSGELTYLEEHGVKFYEAHYPNGVYRIEIADIRMYGKPVELNRQGDGDQIATSVFHWAFEGKPEKKGKKKTVASVWDKIPPLTHVDPNEKRSLFG